PHPGHAAAGDAAPRRPLRPRDDVHRRGSGARSGVGAHALADTRVSYRDGDCRREPRMGGLIAYGAYVPYFRLQRASIAAALGSGGGKGTRAVASYDEDSTSMAVEAARIALRGLTDSRSVRQLFFATATPAYLDKTNATAIHAALSLPEEALAVDMLGSVRSGVGALIAAAQSPVPTLVTTSDVRTGLPGGADERDGGDGAAALVFGGDGDQPVIAELVAHASATDEFLDRWRVPG